MSARLDAYYDTVARELLRERGIEANGLTMNFAHAAMFVVIHNGERSRHIYDRQVGPRISQVYSRARTGGTSKDEAQRLSDELRATARTIYDAVASRFGWYGTATA
jgi:hypothetical protein